MDAIIKSRLEDGLNYYKSGDLSLEETLNGFEKVLKEHYIQGSVVTLAEIVEGMKSKIDTSLDDFLNNSDAHVSEYHKEVYKIMAANEKEICDEILADYNSKCSL